MDDLLVASATAVFSLPLRLRPAPHPLRGNPLHIMGNLYLGAEGFGHFRLQLCVSGDLDPTVARCD